ncbi:MAG: RsmD family RNA methyltransferase [Campylobacterota bacterium]|nr:RsmD family RNA methyltransferase [Campylobacterota bacterium]
MGNRNRLRPTMGIVKKSFFDIIASRIGNSIFLDLFAGTGSVGIEALKRGAKKVIFVEKNYKYSEIIRKKTSRYDTNQRFERKNFYRNFYDKNRYEIYRMDVWRFLNFPSIRIADIVYVDPPYDFLDTPLGKEFLQKLFQKAKGNCIITIEHRVSIQLDEIYAGFHVCRTRQFGETELTIYKRKE